MNLPPPEPFPLTTVDELAGEARRLGLDLPVATDTAVLGGPVAIGPITVPNRLCVQPMEGCDATEEGAPGEWTLRRYRRYAEGGFGLVWLEATAVEGQRRSHPRQLWLSPRNARAFASLVRDIKQAARHRWGHEMAVFLQLSCGGQCASPDIDDETLDQLQEAYVEAGRLAREAGFDGVDVKACHGDLPSRLLAASSRAGRYGGALENRSRFIRETTGKLREALPGLVRASRLSIPAGQEPVELARLLQAAGVQVLNVAASPILEGQPQCRPLENFLRLMSTTRAIQQAFPSMPVVGDGYSWFRHFLPNVAAGVVRGGGASLAGIGRAALAYPELAGDVLHTGRLEPDKCCMECSACMQMMKDGGKVGCPVMDGGVYGEEYRHRRHFALDHLQAEARRCLACHPAPCRAGCPARIDVSAFLKAFAEDDSATAYAILRKANPLPEMCSRLCPVGQMCEGRCVLNALEEDPIPIHDIQYAVSWMARQRGLTGVSVAAPETGKRVAVVGGGPAGVACAVTLVERGHQVVIVERAVRLGGTPELLIRASRFTGAHEEMEAILKPAIRTGRLTLKFGCELGAGLALDELRKEYDAVFLATGVWGERQLGHAAGVVSAVSFLEQARSGTVKAVPPKVVLLAGGDCAMDSAVVARELGARELAIVYAGALSDMHWHMADSWFRTEGVQFMTLARPLGYRVDDGGRMTGVRAWLEQGDVEIVLEAGLVVEAMGLGLEGPLAGALQACAFDGHGLVKTAGAHSFACGVPGVFAGGGLINGGASVVQCVAEGMEAGREIDGFLCPAPKET